MNFLTRLRRRFMLTCEDVNEFLVDYFDGRLDESMRERFERHIDSCESCQAFIDQYEKTMAFLREDRVEEEVPEELVERTLIFLREELDS